jgi:cytidine deaminase
MPRRDARPISWRRAIAALPAACQADADGLWSGGAVLRGPAVARLRAGCGGDLATAMLRLLPLAAEFAVAPLSHYRVGAVAAGAADDGGAPALHLGANLEFPGLALNFTVHAEQSAVNHAWLRGETGLRALAVSAAPCGHCRQFLQEVDSSGALPLHMPGPVPGQATTLRLREILPRAFGPGDLGVRGGLMAPVGPTRLKMAGAASRDPLTVTALAAARAGYSPYPAGTSRPLAGAAVELADGSVCAGRLAANAAYNPGLLPLASALAYAQLQHRPGRPVVVRRAVLVERPADSGQRLASEALLAAVAPGVRLEYRSLSG